MKTFQIQQNDSGQRLDRFLKKMLPALSSSLLYKAIRKKQIKVNRKRCTGDQRLQTGDVISLFLPDDCLQTTAPIKKPAHGNADALNVVYEDDNLMILYKPVGMLVHSDAAHPDHCLVNHLHAYLQQKGAYHPDQEQSFAPAICNRLDRNTEGLVIAAKTAEALREINRLIRENRIQKTYLCVLASSPKQPKATLHAYHWKNAKTNMVTISNHPRTGYREIITSYRVLQQGQIGCLAEITLHTGRTHQIRAHMAHIGAPLLGDQKYGNQKRNQQAHVSHQLLCAYQLRWEPEETSCLSYLQHRTFTAPTPDFVKKWFSK
jgi:23S rRNA pseudouridine955/2504/2580 synthase